MRPSIILHLFLLTISLSVSAPKIISAQEVINTPKVILGGLPFTLDIISGSENSLRYEVLDAQEVLIGSGLLSPDQTTTTAELLISNKEKLPLKVVIGNTSHHIYPPYAPGWFSLVPPLVAIFLAILLQEVIISLLIGIWLGALAVAGYNPLSALWRTIDTYAVPALGDVEGGHTQIIIFSLLLGGMVGVIARNGGTQGIVDAVNPLANTSKRGKVATFIAGLAIFFDDYANALIVGNTMRPITDGLKISREKLAYIVDTTAAPVAALVPISTWIGYEVSLIADGMRIAAEQIGTEATLAMTLTSVNPFAVFITSIPYRFYALLALSFVFLTSVMNRDFGPMATAEKRAASGSGLYRKDANLAMDTSDPLFKQIDGSVPKWYNAGIPIVTVIITTLGGLYTTGRASLPAPAISQATFMDIFGASDPFDTLLWGSLAGCIVAIFLSVSQRILNLRESLDAWLMGMKSMLMAVIILTLAWSLGQITKDLGTAQYLAQILSDTVPIELIPMLVFLTAAFISFATGTAYATMAILVPLVIPLTISLGGGYGFMIDGEYSILMGSISSVLAGAIFGDHCSPISDTTVLSSTAAGCDHLDHVKTQLPYAVLVAILSIIIGDIGTAMGLPVWAALLIGIAVLLGFLVFWGTSVSSDDVKPKIAL
jgi:Na+/H+ antiporter NhaC